MFFDSIARHEDATLEPLTREEWFLNEIATEGYVPYGKNLLSGSLPTSTTDGIPGIPGFKFQWQYAVGNAQNITKNWQEAVSFNFIANASWVAPSKLVGQLTKCYRQTGTYILDKGGLDLNKLINGESIVLSYDIRANKPIYTKHFCRCTFSDGSPSVECFDSSVMYDIEPSENWTRIHQVGQLSDDWHEIINGDTTQNVKLYISVYTGADIVTDENDLEVNIRHMKLEYGTEATDYSLSDWDYDYLRIKPLSIGE